MTKLEDIPFKVGQCVESKSFIEGFRGAWFRCKITDIEGSMRQGSLKYYLEYLDYPDEKLYWTKLYDLPKRRGHKKGKMKKQLMVRPPFPPVYRKSEISNINSLLEVSVVVSDEWMVGNLVDWWVDNCYWSGSVRKVLGDGKLQIELLPRPLGEGGCYEVLSKDLRPTLDFSLKDGWTIPTPKVGTNCIFAQLVEPPNKGVLEDNVTTGGRMENVTIIGPLSASASSDGSLPVLPRHEGSPEQLHVSNVSTEECPSDGGININHRCIRKASCAVCVSSPIASKKLKSDSNISLNVMFSNTVEAAVLDLEELANRVKWLKSMLEFSMPFSKKSKPRWKFAEHRPSSTSK